MRAPGSSTPPFNQCESTWKAQCIEAMAFALGKAVQGGAITININGAT